MQVEGNHTHVNEIVPDSLPQLDTLNVSTTHTDSSYSAFDCELATQLFPDSAEPEIERDLKAEEITLLNFKRSQRLRRLDLEENLDIETSIQHDMAQARPRRAAPSPKNHLSSSSPLRATAPKKTRSRLSVTFNPLVHFKDPSQDKSPKVNVKDPRRRRNSMFLCR